ncbi:MAG: hypothetical protein SPF89_11330 [Sphaerochaetaceae bacterium]|nr:hypothetical protein [Sphaerochaetaceae bacterium]
MRRPVACTFLALFALASSLYAANRVLETDRSGIELTGVIGSTMSLWADLNYSGDYAFYLNDGIDNDKAEYLVNSSDHGFQIGTWGLVSNQANTKVTITHDKLKPVDASTYEGIEYRLYIQYPEPDNLTETTMGSCYSSTSYWQSSFSVTYNTSATLTSFSKMGLFVQLDMDSLTKLDDDNAPFGEYASTITLTASAD